MNFETNRNIRNKGIENLYLLTAVRTENPWGVEVEEKKEAVEAVGKDGLYQIEDGKGEPLVRAEVVRGWAVKVERNVGVEGWEKWEEVFGLGEAEKIAYALREEGVEAMERWEEVARMEEAGAWLRHLEEQGWGDDGDEIFDEEGEWEDDDEDEGEDERWEVPPVERECLTCGWKGCTGGC